MDVGFSVDGFVQGDLIILSSDVFLYNYCIVYGWNWSVGYDVGIFILCYCVVFGVIGENMCYNRELFVYLCVICMYYIIVYGGVIIGWNVDWGKDVLVGYLVQCFQKGYVN